jgi:hypothetical protein
MEKIGKVVGRLATVALGALAIATTGCPVETEDSTASTMAQEGTDMTCMDPEQQTVQETIALDTIASCGYYRDSEELWIAAYGAPEDDKAGDLEMSIAVFTGEGTYTTTANQEEGTWVQLISGQGDNCTGGTWDEEACAPADDVGCTITVTESELESMELSDAGNLTTGRVALTVACEVLNDYGHCPDGQSAALTVPGFEVTFDIYDCTAGY